MAYIGKEPVRGQNRELDDISGSFNGGNTAFTMQVGGLNTSAGSVNQLFISVGGVLQNPGTDFTVASSTLTFTTPPASGLDFWGIIQGDAVDINEPADASVTESKLNANAPTNDHVLTADATTSGGFKWAAVSAGTALTGSTNNTITTVTGANAIQGEANLTFDGSTLAVTGKQTISAQPAFRASLTSNVSATNTIVFNSQQYEQGGDNYDPTTGIFTCPVAGLYVFIAQCTTSASDGAKKIELQKGADAIGRAMASTASGVNEHQFLPLTVIQQFSASDTVKVVVTSGTIYGSTGANSQYSQFMGYLLG